MATDAELYSALKYRVEVDPDTGTRRYYNSANQLHSDVGPAVVDANGASAWYQNGLLHCPAGPAVVWPDSVSAWWFKGVRHRIGGAAAIFAAGTCFWYLQGRELSEEEFDTARADTNKMM